MSGPDRSTGDGPAERPENHTLLHEHSRPVTTPLQLPPETAWLVPLLLVGLLLSGIVALVVLHVIRRVAEPDELRARVDSLEAEVEELREAKSETGEQSQSNAD